jgi:hypothetical protein
MIVRLVAALLSMVLLVSCAKNDLDDPKADLGDFKLGLNIVVADNMKKVPISRNATVEEWEAAMVKAIDDRFGRYDETGTKFYNFAVAVDGYALAPPGIPIVAAPKSILVISVSIFDDAAGTLVNPEDRGRQFTIFEQSSAKTLVGSGLTQTREEQIANLSAAAATQIEYWMRENREWFGLEPKRKASPRPGN